MCFNTRPNVKQFKTARTPIIAFKLMKNVTDRTADSPFRRKTWNVGVPYRAPLVTKLLYAGQDIYEGLHCFKSVGAARRYASGASHLKLVPVMIPAGARYYENETQLVSNKMIMLGTSTSLFRKVVKKLDE